MNQQMSTFRPGQPQTYIAQRTFDLGATGMKAIKGDPLQFDGTLLTIAGHAPVNFPQLRGAVKRRWLVLAEEYNPADRSAEIPQSAGVQMRPADGGNPNKPIERRAVGPTTVDHEERVVGDVAAHAAATAERNLTNYRRGSENRAVLPGEAGYVIEEQDGTVVRGLQTPAKQITDITRAGSAIAAANAVKVQAGVAPSREDVMATMTPEQRAMYEQEIAAHKAAYDPEGAARMMQNSSQVVGHVRAPADQQKEGFNIANSVGGGTEIHDAGGTGVAGPAQESVIEEGGITFRTTNGPKKNVRLVDAEPTAQKQVDRQVEAALASPADDALCRQIAKAICPDFPENYVFSDPIRKKIARLQADYDDRPDIIRAVAAAETDGATKQRVVQEFPEAFQ